MPRACARPHPGWLPVPVPLTAAAGGWRSVLKRRQEVRSSGLAAVGLGRRQADSLERWFDPATGDTPLGAGGRPDPTKPVPAVSKAPAELAAINGSPDTMIEYFKDERFGTGPIWMFNLLQFEPGAGAELYREYAARAAAKIGGMKAATGGGGGGGITMTSATAPFALLAPPGGEHFDTFAVMQYPSRGRFMQYVASGGGGDRKGPTARGKGGGDT